MYINRKKEIIYFDERQSRNEYFHLSMAGITLPNPNYIISHEPKGGAVWDRCNFEYVVSGKGYIETKDKKITVSAGDLFFLNKLQQHTYYADRNDPYEKFFIVIDGTLVDELLRIHGVTGSSMVVHVDARKVFETIFSIAERCGNQTIDSRSYSELSCCFLKLVQMIAPPDFTAVSLNQHPAVLIRNYIDTNIYEHIKISDIAEVVHLSVSQIERIFKAKYGVSLMKYAQEKKLETARQLFMTTHLNIGEISERLSFNSPKYFSRQFKLKYGISPSEYIRLLNSDPFAVSPSPRDQSQT